MTIDTRNDCQTIDIALPLDQETKIKLTEFVNHCNGTHYRQLPAWLEVLDYDQCRFFISRTRRGDIVASSIYRVLQSRIPLYSAGEIARGPIAISNEHLAQHLDDILQFVKQDICTLFVNPFVADDDALQVEEKLVNLGFHATTESGYYTHTLSANIRSSAAEQWRGLRRSTRTAINKARKCGLSVRLESESQAYGNFSRSYSKFARARGIITLSPDISAGIFTHFVDKQASNAFLLSAIVENSTVGQILLMKCCSQLIYEWGWTATASIEQKLPIMHPLLWDAINIARSENCTALDLGGYWMDRDNSDPINQFKLGFSKKIVRYCGQFEYVFSPNVQRLRSVVRKLGQLFDN